MHLTDSFVKRFATLALAAALPTIAAAQALPTFHVSKNLTASAPLQNCLGLAINDSGAVAGSCDDATLSRVAVQWRSDGSFVSYGDLLTGRYASPTALNSLGVVVGDADPGNFRPNPFVTLNGKLLDVDTISGGNARAIGITDTGVIFGNLTKSLSGNTNSWKPTMWTVDPGHPDRYKENFLPIVSDGNTKTSGASVWGSNKAGQAAGWVFNSTIGQLGGFWNNDATHSVVVLQPLPGGYHSIAWGINDVGQAVGESSDPVNSQHAVLWQNDAAHSIVDIGFLPGDNTSEASGINSAGQVVGVSSGSGANQRVFFWQNGTLAELATLIDPADGVWTLTSVNGINNAGQIVANGTNNGVSASIILSPMVQ